MATAEGHFALLRDFWKDNFFPDTEHQGDLAQIFNALVIAVAVVGMIVAPEAFLGVAGAVTAEVVVGTTRLA